MTEDISYSPYSNLLILVSLSRNTIAMPNCHSPGVEVMNISASVVSDGLENVWIALGGTTITLPSVASKSPSGVVNLTVPMAISVPSQGEVPDIGRSARTFDDEKTLVVKSMPVHGRS